MTDRKPAPPPPPNQLETVSRNTKEHEVFLSFNSDVHAEMFRDWLCIAGLATFQAWAIGVAEDYK